MRIENLGISGHRPDKLDGYDLDTMYYQKMILYFISFFREHAVKRVYTGMALGVDQVAALAVLRLKSYDAKIQLVCCIPCRNHSCKWPKASRELYGEILDESDEIIMVSNEEYQPYLMQKRNMYIVDNVEHMLAVWDGSSGGTANCIEYARKVGRPVTIWNPMDFR